MPDVDPVTIALLFAVIFISMGIGERANGDFI
jgi:hypothetical protein